MSADDEPGGASDDSVGLSMVNALPESPDHPVVRPGIVHRLDKGTSGLLVVAKRDRAHQPLADQFKAHNVDRMYSALVWGHPDPPNGSIRSAIGRDPHNRQRMAVVPEDDGKWAVTHYETNERLPYTSLLSFRLETGRTHQIRVHTQYRNHPIIGDPKYSARSIQRGPHDAGRRSFFDTVFERLTHPALHAHRLGFRHPITEEKMHFEVDPPSDWQWVLQKLRERAEL